MMNQEEPSTEQAAVVEVAEQIEKPISAEMMELATLDPFAALIADVPHKSRDLAEFVVAEMKEPSVRQVRSDAEVKRNLQGRVIRRDIKQYIKFLSSKFYPAQSEREMARNRKRIEQGRLTVG